MFGFVEQVTGTDKKTGLALAGRLNFSAAKAIERADKTYLENDWKTLKILASPKLPSPALYFKKGNGQAGYNAKYELFPSPTGSHPQGRKFYLHHKNTDNWKTKKGNENINQKMQVQPVKKGISFLFHIDFENLTNLELGALIYALSPTEKFQHKIGLGKPLGLGSITINVEGLFFVNRADRYTADGLIAQRYSEFWRNDKSFWEWSELYQCEKSASQTYQAMSLVDFVKEFRDKVIAIGNQDLLQSIEVLGSSKLNDVHYPKVSGKTDEEENFLWFVANDLPIDKPIRKMKIDNADVENTATKHYSLKPIIDGKIEPLEDIPLR